MKKILFLIIIALVASNAQAQVAVKGSFFDKIVAAKKTIAARSNEKSFLFTTINNESETQRAEKISKECATCRSEFYGTGIDVEIDLKKQNVAELENGTLWSVSIESSRAYALQFYFYTYQVPEGAELYIVNADGTMKLGAFGAHNNHPDEKFATQTIAGDKITIYYFEPKDVSFPGRLKIGKVIHAFKEVYQGSAKTRNGFGTSLNCEIDINCPQGSDYQDVKRAVARISYYNDQNNFVTWCTGSLINTTSNSKKPYLMTAYHCVTNLYSGTDYRYWQWIFEFNYEKAFCNGSVEPGSNSVQGSTLLTMGKESDYALLNLSPIPDSYGVVYLGWDARNILPTKITAIHHPSGDVKKISFETDQPTLLRVEVGADGRSIIESGGTPLTDFKLMWNSGVTEGGSSGSPMFNQDKRFVGQFRGGESNCSKAGPDYSGRLYHSYTHPDIQFPTLKSFLDDTNSGASNWSTLDPQATPNETFKVNSIELTSEKWEDFPKLFARVSYTGNISALTYSWEPAADFLNPREAVPLLYFGGNKPHLPLTKQYKVTVTTPTGKIGQAIATISLFDCANKDLYFDVCIDRPSRIGFVSGPNETYLWTPPDNLSSATNYNPMFTAPSTGIFEYSVTATNINCTRTENVHVNVFGPRTPPAFSPEQIGQTRVSTGGFAGMDVFNTTDGNFIVVDRAFFMTKLRPDMTQIWRKKITARSVPGITRGAMGVPDGYIIVASLETGASANRMVSIIKTDFDGNILWERDYPPSTSQESYQPFIARKLNDGSIVVSGEYSNATTHKVFRFLYRYNSTNGDVVWGKFIDDITGRNPMVVHDDDIFIVTGKNLLKISGTNGALTAKSHTLSPFDPEIETHNNVIQSLTWGHDGSLIGVAGTWNEATSSVDARVVKFDVNANFIWERTFGGTGSENWAVFQTNQLVLPTSDGGYLFGCSSDSPASGNKSQNSWDSQGDYWIVKMDANGTKLGDVRYGGTKFDQLAGIVDVGLGTYVAVGNSQSAISGDRTVPMARTFEDMWLVKFLDTNSPSTNPTPQTTILCTSSAASFDNWYSPYRDEKIVVGGETCTNTVSFESGSRTSMRGSVGIVIKPNTMIKSGSRFVAKIGPVLQSPCDVPGPPNPSTLPPGIDSDVRVFDASELFAQESVAEKVTLYPNPANQEIKISAELNGASNVYLTISNSLGVVLFQKEYRSVDAIEEVVNSSEFSNGVYVVTLRLPDKTLNEKIVITK